jgi:hypothetical protein
MCRENAGFLAVSKETDNTNKQQRRRKLVLWGITWDRLMIQVRTCVQRFPAYAKSEICAKWFAWCKMYFYWTDTHTNEIHIPIPSLSQILIPLSSVRFSTCRQIQFLITRSLYAQRTHKNDSSVQFQFLARVHNSSWVTD